MHYLHRLSLELDTWFINVEDEGGGGVDLPSMSTIHFDLDQRTFDAPYIPATFFCSLPDPVTTTTNIWTAPDSTPAPLQRQSARMGRDR